MEGPGGVFWEVSLNPPIELRLVRRQTEQNNANKRKEKKKIIK